MHARPAFLVLAAAASAARVSSAHAQQTQITFEGSSDQGQTWQVGTIAAVPGATLLVRARISLVNAGTTTVLGLAGLTFQPKLTGWTTNDLRIPFTRPDGLPAPEEPQSYTGRIYPFASSGMGPGSAAGLLTSHIDSGNSLRFAGANALSPTTNTAWGVSSGQTPANLGLPSEFRSGTDVVVFRYSVTLAPTSGTNRELTATVDLAAVLGSRAAWYRTFNGSNSLLAPVTQDTIIPLRITVPAPSVLTPGAITFLAAPRRRGRGLTPSSSTAR